MVLLSTALIYYSWKKKLLRIYIGVWTFGVNARSNFILIRHFDWPYKKFIIRSAVCTCTCDFSKVLLPLIILEDFMMIYRTRSNYPNGQKLLILLFGVK